MLRYLVNNLNCIYDWLQDFIEDNKVNKRLLLDVIKPKDKSPFTLCRITNYETLDQSLKIWNNFWVRILYNTKSWEISEMLSNLEVGHTKDW